MASFKNYLTELKSAQTAEACLRLPAIDPMTVSIDYERIEEIAALSGAYKFDELFRSDKTIALPNGDILDALTYPILAQLEDGGHDLKRLNFRLSTGSMEAFATDVPQGWHIDCYLPDDPAIQREMMVAGARKLIVVSSNIFPTTTFPARRIDDMCPSNTDRGLFYAYALQVGVDDFEAEYAPANKFVNKLKNADEVMDAAERFATELSELRIYPRPYNTVLFNKIEPHARSFERCYLDPTNNYQWTIPAGQRHIRSGLKLQICLG